MRKLIRTPVTYEQIKDLRIGDTVYLSGVLATCRDAGHRRVLQEGIMPELIDLKDGAIFHAGPIVGRDDDGREHIVSIGPTTSSRMESVEADFIAKTGVRLIIGKGGMQDRTAEACREYGAIHCAFPGGCAVIAAREVEEITGCEWRDLGMPEAMWIMKVNGFGPMVVSIDTTGANLFEEKRNEYREKLSAGEI